MNRTKGRNVDCLPNAGETRRMSITIEPQKYESIRIAANTETRTTRGPQ